MSDGSATPTEERATAASAAAGDGLAADPRHAAKRPRIPGHELGLVVVIALFGAYFATKNANFLTLTNVGNILEQITFVGILVVGMTFVVVSGQFDLSVGSAYALVGVIFATFLKHGMPLAPAIVLALLSGVALGLFNGLLVVGLRVPAIVVTLGTLNVYRGIVYAISGTFPISEFPQHAFVFTFAQHRFPSPADWLPELFAALLVAGVIGHLLMTQTAFGHHVAALGSNTVAAARSGVRVKRVQVLVLTAMGLAAGVAGILGVAQAGTADPSAGTGFELQSIAAVIIGGAALTGGRGTILASLLGMLLIGEVQNGLILSGVGIYGQTIFSGALIIAAVAIDTFVSGREHGLQRLRENVRRVLRRPHGEES